MSTKTKENTEEAKVAEQGDQSKDEAKAPKYKKEELLAIFDEMMFSGEYTEEVTIKDKLKVVFRTRSTDDTTAITRQLDARSKEFTLLSTIQEQRALLNLGYSVVMYHGKSLKDLSIEDRVKFIGKLPAVVTGALSEALIKFDAKTDAACQEGEANF